MFCRNCGKELTVSSEGATPEICVGCGARPLAGNSFCPECGGETTPLTEVCVKCGIRVAGKPAKERAVKAREGAAVAEGESPKSRLIVALLCFFLGWFGGHRFYLGKIRSAIGMLALNIVAVITMIIALVAGAFVPVLWLVFVPFAGLFWFALWIWVVIDLILILIGNMKDKEGRPITRW